jgi:exodeoxyribonuclease III
VRLISWNVNSIRARLPRVLELLVAHTPDVVCVQETKVAPEVFPHDALASVGYRAVDHSGGRWNGVALLVLSDREVSDVQSGLPGEPVPDDARWIEGTVDGVRVVSVYVPNGRAPDDATFPAKLTFLEAARKRAAALVAAGPTVIAGDMNVAPEDRDVWDPAAFVGASHVTPDERQRLAAIIELGLVDAYRRVAPDEVGFTWWDYRMGSFRRGWGMRIDLALVSGHLDVTGCEVDTRFRRVNEAGDKPSDHAPLVVELGG